MTRDALGQLVYDLKGRVTPGRRDHLTFRGNTSQGRHGWLRLTPAYSLHVVEEILRAASPNDFVLDPFSGTGTTPLAAASAGIRCHAVDINPFLAWLGNLKIAEYPEGTDKCLQDAANEIVADLDKRKRPQTAWTPNIHQIEKWWDPEVLASLAALFEQIGQQRDILPSTTIDLLKIAFCRVMIQTANVSFRHQSMSFKKKRSATRQQRLFDDLLDDTSQVYDVFRTVAAEIAGSLHADQPSAQAEVFVGDSRCLTTVLPRKNYTKVITSPPYPNRMSYIREVRPYMYWLGYLQTGRQAGELDWEAIGGTWGCATSLLGNWQPSSSNGIPYSRFSKIVRSISNDHEILGRYVHKYFEDIKKHVESLQKVLASRAECYYVVGNSKFYGTLLPVQEIYAAIFDDAGFANIRVETIRKRTSKKELYEYVVSAEK